MTGTRAAKREQKLKPIAIKVSEPAGPAPLGAPVETSIPFAEGKLRDTADLIIMSPGGNFMPSQMRPVLLWPDGSVRWLNVIFEADAGPGIYQLTQGKPGEKPDLLQENAGQIFIDTGVMKLSLPAEGKGLLTGLCAYDENGQLLNLLKEAEGMDLVMLRHDGKSFRALLDQINRRVIIEERGPVRASLRIEGKCRAEDEEALFDYILRIQAYRSRPEVLLSLTWINATEHSGEQIKDIRLTLPFELEANRLVFGCDTGIYDGPFIQHWAVSILQEDHNWYWAKTLNADGRWLNLSSGGCNGEHCPGWLYVANEKGCLGVWLENFWEEYPNELYVKDDVISLGLWPEKAANHLASKTLMPSNPSGDAPYRHWHYWPIMPHPYLAFFDGEKKCLDVPQGVAKTQAMVISVAAGKEKSSFEKKWWKKSLKPVRGFVEAAQIDESRACHSLWPKDEGNFPEAERVFEECFGWFDRHIDLLKCYGKFDYGDFRYALFSTTEVASPGTKWGSMGEMAREGYWHNNERDVLRGLLLYYLRTGNSRAWELSKIAARHLLDVDIRHHPYFGLYTHGYGHCYPALGEGGEPDHSWLLGLLEWAGVSGDPLVWEWMNRCADYLAQQKIDFRKADARTNSLYIHMMAQFSRYTGNQKYLEAAKPALEALLAEQKPDGSFPAYLGKEKSIIGFVEHAVMAIADYYDITEDVRCLQPLEKALQWIFSDAVTSHDAALDNFDIGEGGLALYGLAVLGEKTRSPLYARLARLAFKKLDEAQDRSPNPYGRGDFWPRWQVNQSESAEDIGRPPQFCRQSRPFIAGNILAYTPRCLGLIAKEEKLSLPGETDVPVEDFSLAPSTAQE